jgi:hypothetical protein
MMMGADVVDWVDMAAALAANDTETTETSSAP